MGRKLHDHSGELYGLWTVLQYVGDRKYLCRCRCGTERLVRGDVLKSGLSKSCGCDTKRLQSLSKIEQGPKEDLTGRRFGRRTVIRYAGNSSWLCRCSCGAESVVQTGRLNFGDSMSCGCLSADLTSERNRKYPPNTQKLKGVYYAMHDRCEKPNLKHYSRYGMRGIKVCDEWSGENGLANFIEWSLKNGYDPKAEHGEKTIDRIDNDGPYSPENCRWVTQTENSNNRSTSRFLEYNGERKTFADWARCFNVPYHIFYTRVARLHWNVEDAVSKPIEPRAKRKKSLPKGGDNDGRIQAVYRGT